jgi:predicted metal-dependent phosphoesterase TrpH
MSSGDNNRIVFAKPNLKTLSVNNTVVDMHFHSRYSDGLNPVDKIAQKAKRLGIGLAITDHNEIKGAVELNKHKDILTIPGIEVTSKEGSHLLVYFYDIKRLKQFYKRDIKPFMGNGIMSSLSISMEDIITRVQKYNAVIAFAHPFCAAYTGVCNHQFPQERLENLLSMVDGVEVINAGNINKWNLKCAVLGFNLNKSILGGSDGHSLAHMGKAITYAACKKNRRAFLDSIKNRTTKVMGKEIDILRKFTSNSLKLRTNISNYPNLFEKNIKYSYAVLNSKSKILKDTVKKRMNGKRRRDSKGEFVEL